MSGPVLAGNFHDAPHIMRRAIASCAAHVSGVCISVDPRYPEDGAVVRAFCDEHGLPHHVFEGPRITGGQIRTDLMREAEAFAQSIGATYLVNLDADDELAFDEGFQWPDDGADVYWIEEHFDDRTYPFKRLFRVGLGWAWYGPIHEEPYCAASPLDADAPMAPGVRYIKHIDGDRPPDDVLYARYADICRAWLVDHPADHRYAFYLARSLHCVPGREIEAVEAYEAYIARADGTAPQRYMAAMSVAEIVAKHAVAPTDLLALLSRTVEIAPDRAEPWRMVAALARQAADRMAPPVGAVMLDAGAYGRRG